VASPATVYGGRVRRLAVAALLVLVAACNRDQPTVGSTAPTASTTTTVAPTSGPAHRTTTTAPKGRTTATSTPAVPGPAYLTAVRVARQSGFDRVVFEFEGGPPGYTVGYVGRPVTEDGSGRTVAVDGAAVLQVRMEQAAGARLSGETVTLTYRGPKRIRPAGTASVVELVATGDFEAVLTWVIGTRAPTPVTVTRLTAPSRVVVDVAHTGAG
jgi:hypothetical protein